MTAPFEVLGRDVAPGALHLTDDELAGLRAELVRQIDAQQAALAKIDAGTYGTCESCSLPIPLERLQAVPDTRFCVGCPRSKGLFG